MRDAKEPKTRSMMLNTKGIGEGDQSIGCPEEPKSIQ
jgi:hypothetical protein